MTIQRPTHSALPLAASWPPLGATFDHAEPVLGAGDGGVGQLPGQHRAEPAGQDAAQSDADIAVH